MKRRLIALFRVAKAGGVNFVRNVSLSIAAMAVMIVTLTIILFSIVASGTYSHTISSITDKIDISVFLKDNVTTTQKDDLLASLRSLPTVKKVDYLSPEQATESFRQQNAGNEGLQKALNITGSTLPATIHVYPTDLNLIKPIEAFLVKPDNKKLQTSDSPSYKGDRKEAIDNLTKATNALQRIGLIAVIVFAVISALIIFNTIQMAIFNRRDELKIMRLLGASTWFIRGPFVVESIIYGILSALISILLIEATFVTAHSSLQASSLGLLDIGYASSFFGDHLLMLLLLQLVLGILIGAVSSVIATHRYLKFKSAK